MRRPRGAAAIVAIAALALFGLAALPGDGQAHNGQLSPKDGCHKHKAAGERHWHKPESAERGGACLKQGGITYRVLELEAEPAPPALPWEVCALEWNAAHADLGSYWAPTLQARASALMGCLRGGLSQAGIGRPCAAPCSSASGRATRAR